MDRCLLVLTPASLLAPAGHADAQDPNVTIRPAEQKPVASLGLFPAPPPAPLRAHLDLRPGGALMVERVAPGSPGKRPPTGKRPSMTLKLKTDKYAVTVQQRDAETTPAGEDSRGNKLYEDLGEDKSDEPPQGARKLPARMKVGDGRPTGLKPLIRLQVMGGRGEGLSDAVEGKNGGGRVPRGTTPSGRRPPRRGQSPALRQSPPPHAHRHPARANLARPRGCAPRLRHEGRVPSSQVRYMLGLPIATRPAGRFPPRRCNPPDPAGHYPPEGNSTCLRR